MPSFTGNWLRQQGQDQLPVNNETVNKTALALTLVVGIAASFIPAHPITGILAFAAAVCHGFRLIRWKGFATISNPFIIRFACRISVVANRLCAFGLRHFRLAVYAHCRPARVNHGCHRQYGAGGNDTGRVGSYRKTVTGGTADCFGLLAIVDCRDCAGAGAVEWRGLYDDNRCLCDSLDIVLCDFYLGVLADFKSLQSRLNNEWTSAGREARRSLLIRPRTKFKVFSGNDDPVFVGIEILARFKVDTRKPYRYVELALISLIGFERVTTESSAHQDPYP